MQSPHFSPSHPSPSCTIATNANAIAGNPGPVLGLQRGGPPVLLRPPRDRRSSVAAQGDAAQVSLLRPPRDRRSSVTRRSALIIIISLLRHDRYKNENTWHNTIEQTKTKFPKTKFLPQGDAAQVRRSAAGNIYKSFKSIYRGFHYSFNCRQLFRTSGLFRKFITLGNMDQKMREGHWWPHLLPSYIRRFDFPKI